MEKNKKLDSLGFLRGVAVLLVCVDHFGTLLSPQYHDTFKLLGRYGVHIFFVISGFVIPLSLYKGKYILSDYGRFLYKRFLRLQPPYVVSVCLTFFLIFLSALARHAKMDESFVSFLQTLFYFHIPNMNPVYWTLIVEAQYYIVIGLLFPFLIIYPRLCVTILFPLIPLINYFFAGFPSEHSINFLAQSPTFFVGILGFMLYSRIGNTVWNISSLILFFLIIAYYSPFADLVASFFTLLFILFYSFPISELLQFPGKISYSVYLIHFPVSFNFITFLMSRTDKGYRLFIYIGAMLTVFIVGYLFYRLFEVRSEKWSSSVKYRQGKYKINQPVKDQNLGDIEQAAVQ